MQHVRHLDAVRNTTSNGAINTENLNPNTDVPSDFIRSSNDPYSPNLVYDLLQGKKEWKNIQDIVKLTFIAICDTVKSQGTAIRDLERQVHRKANTEEIMQVVREKANVSDVSRTVAELQIQLDRKQGMDDIARLMEDRVTKQDLQYMISNKVSIEELTRVLQTKCNVHEVNMDISQMNLKIEEILKDISKRINNCAL